MQGQCKKYVIYEKECRSYEDKVKPNQLFVHNPCPNAVEAFNQLKVNENISYVLSRTHCYLIIAIAAHNL